MSGYLSERSRAWQIAMAIIQARQAAKEIAKPIKIEVLPEVKIKPKITLPIERSGIVVNGVETLVDVRGSGTVEEMTITTNSKDYTLHVFDGGDIKYSKPFSWFQDRSQTVGEISAFENTGVYTLNLHDINFKERIRVFIDGFLTVNWFFTKIQKD